MTLKKHILVFIFCNSIAIVFKNLAFVRFDKGFFCLKNSCFFNLIEIENGTPNDFKYYNIEIILSDAIEMV